MSHHDAPPRDPLSPPPVRTVRIEVAGSTHVGVVRQDNEDAVVCHGWVTGLSGAQHHEATHVVPGAAPALYAVVDGMGGHAGGAAAAATASVVLARELGAACAPDDVARALAVADRTVAAVGDALGTPDMGATVAGVLVDHERVTVLNVGDSRVYRYLNGYLGQLSIDDRVPAPGASGRTYVTQSLGGRARRILDPHLLDLPHAAGLATYLVCSDGLHDVVGADAIREAFAGSATPAETATTLVAHALRAGAPDNVSVVVVEVRVADG